MSRAASYSASLMKYGWVSSTTWPPPTPPARTKFGTTWSVMGFVASRLHQRDVVRPVPAAHLDQVEHGEADVEELAVGPGASAVGADRDHDVAAIEAPDAAIRASQDRLGRTLDLPRLGVPEAGDRVAEVRVDEPLEPAAAHATTGDAAAVAVVGATAVVVVDQVPGSAWQPGRIPQIGSRELAGVPGGDTSRRG